MDPTQNGHLSASPMQASMLLPTIHSEQHLPYVQQLRWTFREDLNEGLFKEAWNKVLQRHDVFSFKFERNLSIQIESEPLATFEFKDWSRKPTKKRPRLFKELLREDFEQGFSLSDPTFCRFTLIRFNAKCSELIWTNHHALLDGRARLQLIREFVAIYDGLLSEQSVELPPAPNYSEYLSWVQSQDWQQARRFWKKQLAHLDETTPLNFGLENTEKNASDRKCATVRRSLNRELTAQLKRWARDHAISLNILSQAAWGLFLSLSSGEDTVIFGAPRACRKSNVPGSENTVGLFVNTVPIVVRVDRNQTVRQYLECLQKNWLALRTHENTPLQEIHQASGIPTQEPLFESLIGFEKYQLTDQFKNYAGHKYRFTLTANTEFPFALELKDGNRPRIEVSYQLSRFSPYSIEQVIEIFIHLLEQLTQSESAKVDSISLLKSAAKTRIKKMGTGPRPKIPHLPVHKVFEEQVTANPKSVAIRYEGKSTSYRVLNQKANRLARYLLKRGVKRGACIGILMDRSDASIVAQLAILKAGGYFLPLELDYPEERLLGILQDAQPRWILTTSNLKTRISNQKAALITIDSPRIKLATQSTRNLVTQNDPNDPAYVMYTSGSTGMPKGVVVPHRAITRLVKSPNYVKLSRSTRCLQMATISFDASTFEIWGPLLNGGCCAVYPERIPSLESLEIFLKQERVNTLWLTASLFNFIVDTAPEILAKTRQLITGGEALSPQHIRKAQRALPNTRLINGYGPTEGTTFSCCYPIPNGHNGKQNLPIGKAISHTTAYIVSKQEELLPVGMAGELYVGGLGVALGYLNKDSLTRERFIPNPFSKNKNDLLYRTGDRAYFQEDGRLEYLGRFDDQVKIRGFRIEPSEIQNRLERLKEVLECAVVVRKNQRDEKMLVAFVVLKKKNCVTEERLKELLGLHLPEYMIPNQFVFYAKLPLTKNGKVDRKHLQNCSLAAEVDPSTPEGNLSVLETDISNYWEEVLKKEPENADQNFMDAGGHSLLATQFIYKLQAHFRIPIPIDDFQKNANVRQLAKLISRRQRTAEEQAGTLFEIKPHKTKRLEPLSIPFQTIYWPDVDQPEITASNHIVRAIELMGDFERPIFEKTLELAVNNHERYRTYITKNDTGYFEELLPHITPEIAYSDYSDQSEKQARKHIRKTYNRMCKEWVTVRKAPLFRCVLSKLSPSHYFFCFSINHAICDGNSLGQLFKELSIAYNDLRHGRPVSLTKPPYSYTQYEKSLRKWLAEGNEARIKAFWARKLKNLKPIDFPFLKKNLPNKINWNDFDHNQIDDRWTHKIRAFTSEHHSTPYLFFLSLTKWLIARYTGNLDSYVASSTNTRSDDEEAQIGGELTSVILIRNSLSQDRTFLEQLKRDQATFYEAMDQRRLGVTTVAKPFKKGGLNIHKVGGQCRVTYAPALESDFDLDGINTKAWLRTRIPALMRFGLIVREHQDQLLLSFQHAPEIYLKHALEHIKVNLQEFVQLVLERPHTRFDELPDLSNRSRYKKPVSKDQNPKGFLRKIRYLTSFSKQKLEKQPLS